MVKLGSYGEVIMIGASSGGRAAGMSGTAAPGSRRALVMRITSWFTIELKRRRARGLRGGRAGPWGEERRGVSVGAIASQRWETIAPLLTWKK